MEKKTMYELRGILISCVWVLGYALVLFEPGWLSLMGGALLGALSGYHIMGYYLLQAKLDDKDL